MQHITWKRLSSFVEHQTPNSLFRYLTHSYCISDYFQKTKSGSAKTGLQIFIFNQLSKYPSNILKRNPRALHTTKKRAFTAPVLTTQQYASE